jgi:hypothetical protein
MTAANPQYDIEGELLSLEQIAKVAARVHLPRATVRTRLQRGDRTWAQLLRQTDRKPRLNFGRNRGERRTAPTGK